MYSFVLLGLRGIGRLVHLSKLAHASGSLVKVNLTSSILGNVRGLVGNLIAHALGRLEECLDLILVLSDERLEERVVDNAGTVGLGKHKVDEEDQSDDAVVRNPVKDEAGEELEGLDGTEKGPVAQPRVGLLILAVLDGQNGSPHGVDARDEREDKVVTLKDETDEEDGSGKSSDGDTRGNTSLLAGVLEALRGVGNFLKLVEVLLDDLHL